MDQEIIRKDTEETKEEDNLEKAPALEEDLAMIAMIEIVKEDNHVQDLTLVRRDPTAEALTGKEEEEIPKTGMKWWIKEQSFKQMETEEVQVNPKTEM